MGTLEFDDFSSPAGTRRPDPHATVDVVHLAGGEVGRYTFQPGWRWSEHIKPVVGDEPVVVVEFEGAARYGSV